jgi:hypothetical protein
MIKDFNATSIEDFQARYLNEVKLDKSYIPRLGGKIYQMRNKNNVKFAEELRDYAVPIHNELSRYIARITRRNPDININIRELGLEDIEAGGAVWIIIDINRTSVIDSHATIRIGVFDYGLKNVHEPQDDPGIINISISDPIAGIINKKEKSFLSRDKAIGWVLNVMEAVAV